MENANKSDQISFADMAVLNGFLTVAVGVSSCDAHRFFRFKDEKRRDAEPTVKLLRDRITVNSEVAARAAASGRTSQ